jgi:hypothetical protein
MRKTPLALILASTLLSTTVIANEVNMRPGLWEMETTSDLLLLVPHIPADQLKSVQDLAKEYGLEMPKIEHGSAISRSCVTQEMAAQKTLPKFYQEELGCVSNDAVRNGNRYKISFTCNGPDLKGNGTAEGLITGPQSFSGTTQFIGQAQGMNVNEKADISGKWVAANCGNVKPL